MLSFVLRYCHENWQLLPGVMGLLCTHYVFDRPTLRWIFCTVFLACVYAKYKARAAYTRKIFRSLFYFFETKVCAVAICKYTLFECFIAMILLFNAENKCCSFFFLSHGSAVLPVAAEEDDVHVPDERPLLHDPPLRHHDQGRPLPLAEQYPLWRLYVCDCTRTCTSACVYVRIVLVPVSVVVLCLMYL